MIPKHFTKAIVIGFLCPIVNGHCSNPEQPNPLQAAQSARVSHTIDRSLAESLDHASQHGAIKSFSFKYGGGTTVIESQGKKTVKTEINETSFHDGSSFHSSTSKQKSSFGLKARDGTTKGSLNFTGGSRTTTSSESRDIQRRGYTEVTSTTRKETTTETNQDATAELEVHYSQLRHGIRRSHTPQRAAHDLND